MRRLNYAGERQTLPCRIRKPRKMGRSAADSYPPTERRSHAIARRHLQGAAAEKHRLVECRHGGALTPPPLRGQASRLFGGASFRQHAIEEPSAVPMLGCNELSLAGPLS